MLKTIIFLINKIVEILIFEFGYLNIDDNLKRRYILEFFKDHKNTYNKNKILLQYPDIINSKLLLTIIMIKELSLNLSDNILSIS